LVILDACRNDPTDQTKGAEAAATSQAMTREINDAVRSDAESGNAARPTVKAQAILNSCWEGQVAFEYPPEKHSWFYFNLKTCLGEDPRGECDVMKLGEKVRQQMLDTAWRALPAGSEQTPHLTSIGRPLRLAMVPLRIEPKPQAVESDPTKVVVKEVTVAPIRVESERIEKEQVVVGGLPPIPTDILELEGELEL